MTAGSGGWRRAVVRENPFGVDYGFMLDGDGPFPDPRSPSQPHGVHGLSRLVDHDTFPWTDGCWQAPPLSSAVVYELHVGTFTPEGTFGAAIPKLDHLATLGITHVELMPVNEFSGQHGWGYDGVDLFAPHHTYGQPDDLKRLVDAAHARRLAVILDVVYNHLGPAGNFLPRFGPYFQAGVSTPWGPAVNFDGRGSDEVRRFFCDNALMWLREYHFDGLRLDAVHAIRDLSAQPFLEQLAIEVGQLATRLGRKLVLIPESDLNDPRLLWARERGGFGLDAQWSDDFHHALHAILTGEAIGYYADFGTLGDLSEALQHGYVYRGRYSVYRGRRHGREPAGLNGHRFLGYLQNHDQVGNRAQGERSSRLMSPGRLKIGAAMVLTAPFVPLLFQGEEWGASSPFLYFSDFREPELAEAVREGRRREFAAFGWNPDEIPDPQAPETFRRSKLIWQELSQFPHAELLKWFQDLIRLRRSEPGLSDGHLEKVQAAFDEGQRWFAFRRGGIHVVCNLARKTQRIPLPKRRFKIVLASEKAVRVQNHHAVLPPDSVVILNSPVHG